MTEVLDRLDLIDFQHNNRCLNLLVQHCKTEKQYELLVNNLNYLQNNLDKTGLVDVYEAYMSCERYYHISQLILNKKNAVVIDCGCGEGFQQLFFQDCKRYIGIDAVKTQFLLADNASFYLGDVKDILPKLNIDGDTYGISVLCGMCFDDVRQAMYERFDRVINI